MISNGDLLSHLSQLMSVMSLHYLGNMNPGDCLFSDSDKMDIRRDDPHHRIEMKFCMVSGLQEIVLRFEFH